MSNNRITIHLPPSRLQQSSYKKQRFLPGIEQTLNVNENQNIFLPGNVRIYPYNEIRIFFRPGMFICIFHLGYAVIN